MEIFAPADWLNPQLSLPTQAFFRTAYGVLLLCTLLLALPQWKRFFISERWLGYAKSSPLVDFLQNPFTSRLICAVWFTTAILITAGIATFWAAAVNLLLCRYFFIHMRWRGILRGMGAPGFMTYWLAAAVFLLEGTLQYASKYHSLALLVLQVDFAFIMLSAGIYKLTAGYARNHGMEYGMVNPEWGYWWRFYKSFSPDHFMFKLLNHLAWSTEVVAAVLMLIPQTRFIGALLIAISFVYIATQIRLGVLCEMVILGCVLFFHPGSYGDILLSALVPGTVSPAAPAHYPVIEGIVATFLFLYLILLPLAHAGLFYNFYGRRSLPGALQVILEKYTNFFGLIIWRVFSVDVINFCIMIYARNRQSGERTLISNYGWQGGFRYSHVAESICVTSLFTTLKYYAGNEALFRERLLRYARTLPGGSESIFEFEYLSIQKTPQSFEFKAVALYLVDVLAGTVSEHLLDESFCVRKPHAVSPVHEGVRPGSYVPCGS